MTSKDRVEATLCFERPDRLAIYDTFCDETLVFWRKEGRIGKETVADIHFDFDIRPFSFDESINSDSDAPPDHFSEAYSKTKEDAKYLAFSVSCPFQAVVNKNGLESTLNDIALNDKNLVAGLKRKFGRIERFFKRSKADGLTFDGAWLWSDICYENGLLFSPDVYRELLFPLHRDLCDLFHSHGCKVFFHCDGDVRRAIEPLLKAGIDVLHPLQSSTGLTVDWLRREFGRELIIFGNIDFEKVSEGLISRDAEIRTKISASDGLGYIFGCDQPIRPDISFDYYSRMLDFVRHFSPEEVLMEI